MANKDGNKNLGRNCSFDEIERVVIVKAIDAIVAGGVKGWDFILALKSVKMKVEFSKDEIEVLKARAPRPAAAAAKVPLKKVK